MRLKSLVEDTQLQFAKLDERLSKVDLPYDCEIRAKRVRILIKDLQGALSLLSLSIQLQGEQDAIRNRLRRRANSRKRNQPSGDIQISEPRVESPLRALSESSSGPFGNSGESPIPFPSSLTDFRPDGDRNRSERNSEDARSFDDDLPF